MTRKPITANGAHSAAFLASCIAVSLGTPRSANAAEFSLKVEPAVAIPLSAPQSDVFDVGGGQSIKGLIGLTRFLDIGPTVAYYLLPAEAPFAQDGGVLGLGGGFRLKRPHDGDGAGGVSPWLDADLLYVGTGELDRAGFDAAVGLAVPIGERRSFWVGPFARYLQVGQSEDVADYDNRDAKILSFGLSLEAATARDREPVAVTYVEPGPVVQVSCPDGDVDGTPDVVDRCPSVVGTLDDYGCPHYDKIVIREDKLELKEKLYFAWDESTIEPASLPVLDEVVRALNDNRNFRVQVEGHTDSTGSDAHNQDLSERRAQAVLGYLVGHGIAKDRLVSKGFSSSVPMATNTTAAGREDNRRVEFVVNFILLNPGSAK